VKAAGRPLFVRLEVCESAAKRLFYWFKPVLALFFKWVLFPLLSLRPRGRCFILRDKELMNPDNPRLENAIAFFAKEYHARTRRYLPQTLLYKFLSLLDFKILKATGRPVFDIEYLAMNHGPVPPLLYRNKDSIESELFSFVKQGENEYVITAKIKADLNYFSDAEVQEMERLIEIYSSGGYRTTGIASNQSHEEIKAWRDAYARCPNSVMNYADEFENIYGTPEEKLTPEEDRFLLFESFKKMRTAR
jgi:uncharacterized phage-associated protein